MYPPETGLKPIFLLRLNARLKAVLFHGGGRSNC